jgi:uncharacterized alkaline shock family protein YloU
MLKFRFIGTFNYNGKTNEEEVQQAIKQALKDKLSNISSLKVTAINMTTVSLETQEKK